MSSRHVAALPFCVFLRDRAWANTQWTDCSIILFRFCFSAFLRSGPLLLGLSFSFFFSFFVGCPSGFLSFACLLACWWWPALLLACLFLLFSPPAALAGVSFLLAVLALARGFSWLWFPCAGRRLCLLVGAAVCCARGAACLVGSGSGLGGLGLSWPRSPSRPALSARLFVPVPPARFLAVGFLGSFIAFLQ